MYHVFREGEAARQLWSMMENPLGKQHKNQPMTNIFSAWWETKPENAIHKTILKINPTIICWEIWKQWCSCKYGGKKYLQTNKMCYQTVHTIKSVLANTFQNFHGSNYWPSFCLEVERLRPVQIMKQVTWSYPQNGIIKINIDGSYVHETGKAGIGGIIRNSYGDLIMALSFPVECKKSNLVEAMAIEFGVKWCNQHGYTNFILELDSMNIVNMLTNDIVTNMKLKQGIDSINVIKKMVQMQIKHCFIEGNQVADCLAKLASSSHQMLITQLYSNLPRQAKGLFYWTNGNCLVFRANMIEQISL